MTERLTPHLTRLWLDRKMKIPFKNKLRMISLEMCEMWSVKVGNEYLEVLWINWTLYGYRKGWIEISQGTLKRKEKDRRKKKKREEKNVHRNGQKGKGGRKEKRREGRNAGHVINFLVTITSLNFSSKLCFAESLQKCIMKYTFLSLLSCQYAQVWYKQAKSQNT